MHFSLFPWEVTAKCQGVLQQRSQGIFTWWSYDPLITQLARMPLDKIFMTQEGHERKTIFLGPELTRDICEDNFFSAGLFSQNEFFCVLEADEIPTKVKEFILENIPRMESTSYLLSLVFNREDPWRKKLVERKEGLFTHMEIKEPPFWEMEKLFDYFCGLLSLQMERPARRAFLERVDNTPSDFYQRLSFLKMVRENDVHPISESEVLKWIPSTRVDQFAFSSWFADKNYKRFFEVLLSGEREFDSLRSLFAFLQGHFLKMLDADSIRKKPRPNRYEQEILKKSLQWDKLEIQKTLRLFGEWEILAKQRDPFLTEKLRVFGLSFL